ncbi:MAG: radical SAM protein [Theionarchaea archaeon]|nr:radical SAM protein [Theionarchaea archaeon]
MNITEVLCKSALVKSRIYGVDYAVNPYTGCEHNCGYCYAVFMKRYSHHSEPWGEFVDVKINAPTILRKQLSRTKKGRVLFSSVTDAYQPLEKNYEITRRCLEQFLNTHFFVSVLTKSSLVTRDIDILQNLSCEVGFTFTTLDDTVRKIFEPRSTPVPERLHALKSVHESGISTYAFFGPILPFLSDPPESITEILNTLSDYVKYIIVDRMNLYDAAWKRISSILKSWRPELVPHYEALRRDPEYEVVLRKRISEAASVPIDFCF